MNSTGDGNSRGNGDGVGPNAENTASVDVAAGSPTAAVPPTPAVPALPERRQARFGTILWGVILLVFAAFMVTNALVPFSLDAGTWLIVALVAGGVVLIIAGIAAAIRRTD